MLMTDVSVVFQSTIVLEDRSDRFAGADRFRRSPYILVLIRLSITATFFFIDFVRDEVLVYLFDVGIPVVINFVEGVYFSHRHSGAVSSFLFPGHGI